MQTYTVWVQEADRTGTMHVSAHEARTPASAANKALRETRHDWGDAEYALADLTVVGIAKGNVEIYRMERRRLTKR